MYSALVIMKFYSKWRKKKKEKRRREMGERESA